MALSMQHLVSPKAPLSTATLIGTLAPRPRTSIPARLPRMAVRAQSSTEKGSFLEETDGNSKARSPSGALGRSLAAALAAASVLVGSDPGLAELNRFEADLRGEFGIGSAAQYGSADLRGTKHANENFRRANFTSADMREADFSGSVFVGGYLEKSVAYRTNFEGADFTDALMDRMVLNESNLTNAILVRTVLTRSDLGGAQIEGADFSDAVIDLPQKQALCKVAKGTNPVTGMSTRSSLGCGNRRGNAYGTPSAPALSGAPEKFLTKEGFCDEDSGLCKAGNLP